MSKGGILPVLNRIRQGVTTRDLELSEWRLNGVLMEYHNFNIKFLTIIFN